MAALGHGHYSEVAHKESPQFFMEKKKTSETMMMNLLNNLLSVGRQVTKAIQAGEIQQVKHGEYKKL